MKEKIKIIGKGILNNKEYGFIKIDQEQSDLIYDKKFDQYRDGDNQWLIPFHQVENNNIYDN